MSNASRITSLATRVATEIKAVRTELDAVAGSVSSGLTGFTDIVRLTQSEYDALTPKVATVLYVIAADEEEEPPPVTWLVTDNFVAVESPPATADTGQSWRVESGTWSQNAGISAAADGGIILVNLGSTTQTVEFVVGGTVGGGSFPAVLLRYNNTGDTWYMVQQNNNALSLSRQWTSIWTSNANAAPHGATVRVSVTGSGASVVFRVWVNGTELTTGLTGSLTDTSGTGSAGTEAGFRMGFNAGAGTYKFNSFKGDDSVAVP